ATPLQHEPPAPPAPPVAPALAKPLPAPSAVLVVAIALASPPVPPLAPVPPVPPAPPKAFALLLGSLFGPAVAVAGPPGPPLLPAAPSMPGVPTIVTVSACIGDDAAKNTFKKSEDAVTITLRDIEQAPALQATASGSLPYTATSVNGG